MHDAEIIRRSAVEPAAFGSIFDRHFDAIVAFCVRRAGRPAGEDVAGEVFRWAFEHRDRFDGAHDSARPWLFGIAHNLVREATRRTGRQRLAYARLDARSTSDDTELESKVAVAVDAARDLAAVAAVLRDQAPDDVDALLLFAWEQLTYAEIATALDVPVGTVRSRIHRVRRNLEDALGAHAPHRSSHTDSQGGQDAK